MEEEILRKEGSLTPPLPSPSLPPHFLPELVIESRLPDKELIENLVCSTVKKFKDRLDLIKDND